MFQFMAMMHLVVPINSFYYYGGAIAAIVGFRNKVSISRNIGAVANNLQSTTGAITYIV